MQTAHVPPTLKGRIEKVYELGPPGFGEEPRTDRKDVDYLLQLDKPINICYFGQPYSVFKNVRALGDVPKVFVGKLIKASGIIWEPDTAEAATPPAHFNLDLTRACLVGHATKTVRPICKTPIPPWKVKTKPLPVFGTQATNSGSVGRVVATIDGVGTTGLQISSDQNIGYIASGNYGTVSVVNLRKKSVIKGIVASLGDVTSAPASKTEISLVSTEIEKKLYAKGSATLNTAQQFALRDTVQAMKNGPCISKDIALDASKKLLYLTCGGLGVLDLHTGKLIHWIRTGSAQDVVLGHGGRYVYVVNIGRCSKCTGLISIINTESWKVKDTIPLDTGPVSATLGPKGYYLYVAGMLGDTVTVIDVRNLRAVKQIPIPNGPFDVAVSPSGDTLYVSESFGDAVAFVSTSSGKILATVRTGTNPEGMALTHDGKRLYVANFGAGSVTLIDTRTHRLVGTLSVDRGGSWGRYWGPLGLTLNQSDTRLYATDPGKQRLIVISTQ